MENENSKYITWQKIFIVKFISWLNYFVRKKYLTMKWICHGWIFTTLGTNFVFLMTKKSYFADEIFCWQKY